MTKQAHDQAERQTELYRRVLTERLGFAVKPFPGGWIVTHEYKGGDMGFAVVPSDTGLALSRVMSCVEMEGPTERELFDLAKAVSGRVWLVKASPVRGGVEIAAEAPCFPLDVLPGPDALADCLELLIASVFSALDVLDEEFGRMRDDREALDDEPRRERSWTS